MTIADAPTLADLLARLEPYDVRRTERGHVANCPVCGDADALVVTQRYGRPHLRCEHFGTNRKCAPKLLWRTVGLPMPEYEPPAREPDPEPEPVDHEAEFRRFVGVVEQQAADPLPPLPYGVLPPAVAAFVRAAAEAYRVPPEFVLAALLAGLATCLGRRVEMKVGSWTVRAIFWLLVVAPSGGGKTPAQDAALEHFYRIHKALQAAQRRARAEYEERLTEWRGANAKTRGAMPRPPLRRQLYTTDMTMESLGLLTLDNPGVLCDAEEITDLMASMDRYRPGAGAGGGGGDRQKFLQSFGGRPIQVNRVSRDLYIEAPHICIFGGVQPDLMPKVANGSDGWTERWLPLCPDITGPHGGEEGEEEGEEDAIPATVRGPVAALYNALTGFDPQRPVDPSEFDPDRTEPEPDRLVLSPDARALWRSWRRANEALRWQHTGPAHTVYAKFTYHALRFSLLLHCLDHPHPGRSGGALVVERDTLRRALVLTEFCRAHMNRFLTMLGRVGGGIRNDRDRVLDAVVEAGGEPVSTTTITRRLGNNVRGVAGYLAQLHQDGLIGYRCERPDRGPGRKEHLWYALPGRAVGRRLTTLNVDAIAAAVPPAEGEEEGEF